MNGLDPFGLVVIALILVAFARGVRALWKINKIYRSDTKLPRSQLLKTIRNTLFVLVASAGWVAAWTSPRLLGIPLPDWLAMIARVGTSIVAIAIFLIPEYWFRAIESIRRGDPAT